MAGSRPTSPVNRCCPTTRRSDRTCFGPYSCADTDVPLRREAVIDAVVTSVRAALLPEASGGQNPFVKAEAAFAEGIIGVLIRTGCLAIK